MATISNLLVRIRGDSSQLQRELAKSSVLVRGFGSSAVATFAKVGVGASATAAIVGGIFTAHAVRSAINFESAFAGVRKTVDASEPEFAAIREQLLQLSTQIPTTANDLAKIAETAGQLGVPKEAIVQFTRVIADLGETTNLAGEAGATMLARFANITQMPTDSFDRLGSTIVALGNAGASTESEIAEMGMRIAGAGHLVGMSEAEILGLANALSSLGLEAEAGGTATSRVLAQMAKTVAAGGDDLERFAVVAGMSAEQLAESFKDRPVEALQAFIDGLARMNAEGIDLFGVLDDLELGNVRITDTLLRAAGAGDTVQKSIALGNKAWRDNNALTEEARKRYETTAAKIEVLRNKLTRFMIDVGQGLNPVVREALDGISTWFDTHGSQLRQIWANMLPHVVAFGRGVQTVGEAIYAGLGWVIANKPALVGAILAVAGAFVAFTGPIGVLAAVSAGFVTLIGWLRQSDVELDKTRLAFAGLALGVAALALAMGGPLGVIVALFAAVMAALVIFQGNWETVWEQMPDPVQNFVLSVMEQLVNFETWLSEKMTGLAGKLDGFIDKLNKIPGINIPKLELRFEPEHSDLYNRMYEQATGFTAPLNGVPTYGPGVPSAGANQRAFDRIYDSDGRYGPAVGLRAMPDPASIEAVAKAVQGVGDAAAGAGTDMSRFNGLFGDDLAGGDKAKETLEERSRQMSELARAFIAGGLDMVESVRAFHDRANALWPTLVAAASAAGVEMVEDDRAAWEAKLNNGENIVDQLIRLQEERAAREKKLADEVKEAWVRGGAYMAAQVRAHQIELQGQWQQVVAEARANGIELVEADREMWEARVHNGQRYIDQLIQMEEDLAAARRAAQAEVVEAFDRGGIELVARVRQLHADLDAQWQNFVSRARAAGIAVVEADRAAWEARKLNGQSAVDYLIQLEEDLAAERQRLAAQTRQDAISAIDQLGGLLETALQRQYAAQEKAATDAIQRQLDAAQRAARARVEAIDAAKEAALRALDAQVEATKRASEVMTERLVAPLRAQLDALDELDRRDDLQAIADQLKITYDPREEKKLLDQRKRIERDSLRDQLRDRIDQIEEAARTQEQVIQDSMAAQRQAIEDRYEAERRAAEAAAQATEDRLRAQLDSTRAKYAALSDSFAVQSKVRQMLMSGEVDKMAALLDAFVPEWRTAGLSYGQMLIDGIRTSGVEQYIRDVLAQVNAAKAAAAAVNTPAASTVVGMTPGGTPATQADKIADQLAIKRLVDGGAPQAAIDMQRASYQQIYGEPSPYRRGGVFTRPGLGLFGEYPLARTDPEVASPVSTMQEAFREVLQEFGGGFGGPVTVEVYIGGERLDERVDTRIRHHQRGARRQAALDGPR